MRTGPHTSEPEASRTRPKARGRCREGVGLLRAEVVPLDPEHERLALLYLAEPLAPLLDTDGPARRVGHAGP